MTAVRYVGPPKSIRLGPRLVTVGTTISAPEQLVKELLAHPGFEAIKAEKQPAIKPPKEENPSKKQVKKTLGENPLKEGSK
jgi:hypothetical protein